MDAGSSHFFIIALLIFDDTLEAEKMAVSIKELRRKLKMNDSEEFKFNKSSNKIRTEFLSTVNNFDFRIRCLVVNKKQIYSSELKTKKESFYAYFIKEVLKHSNSTIYDAKIRLDGSGDRTFKKQFLAYLRKELNASGRNVMQNLRWLIQKTMCLFSQWI